MTEDTTGTQVWLVERAFSEEKPNLLTLVYATTDGKGYVMKERAITNLSDTAITTAAIEADADDLNIVDEEAMQTQYAAEATRMAGVHAPDDPI